MGEPKLNKALLKRWAMGMVTRSLGSDGIRSVQGSVSMRHLLVSERYVLGAATESGYATPSQSSWEEGNSKIVGMGKIRAGRTLKRLVFKEITGLFSPESPVPCLFAILGGRKSGNRKSSNVCGIVI